MSNYTIFETVINGQLLPSLTQPAPDRIPQPGDEYEFTCPVSTRAGVTYQKGDLLKVLDRTSKAPNFELSSLGNLVVEGKFGTSVWATLESCIARHLLKLVSSK